MWYEIDDIDNLPTPALVFYRARIEENIDKMIEIAGDPARLVPHVKTHKCAEIIEMHLVRGIRRFKCATIAEAEMLGLCKAPEVLLAYQPVGPGISRFYHLKMQYPDTEFYCICDSQITAEALNDASRDKEMITPVYIDLDCGMHRTGISPELAPVLADFIQGLNSLKLKGIHAYDGHLHDPDFEVRERKAHATYAIARQVKDTISSDLEIIMGGSPTFPIHAAHDDLHLSPGTTVLWDKGYGNSQEGLEMFKPAALIVARIISHPSEDIYCMDAGHKAISAEHQRPPEIMGVDSFEVIAHSEEHLAIRTDTALEIGQVMYLVPHHICPTVALHEKAVVIDNNKITDQWLIYRQRKINV